MVNCWRYLCLEPGPNCHWQSQWTIENVRDNPQIYIPDYITKSILGGCTSPCIPSNEPRYRWTYCTSPTTPFQLPAPQYILDTPSSNTR